jgi:integrase
MSKRNASEARIVVERDGGPVYYAKWRDSTRGQVKRKLGPAWAEREPAGAWRKRRGRAPDGYLDEKAAIVEMRRVIDEHEGELATARPESEPTFDEAAADWLHRLEHVDGVKPSTLANYRQMLTAADAPARKRGRRTAGRIVAEFGGRELRAITTAHVERFLERIDREPVGKRTVNAHRQVVSAILEHAARRPERFGITENVARATAKRREPAASVLDFYEPEEVAALARTAREGRHRNPDRPAVTEDESRERRLADEQDAALYTVAAFTGLRLGELRALRWRQVSFERGALTVAAAMSAGQVESPKWGKARTIPLATPAAADLARLADRCRFVARDDLVFSGPLGEPLDDSAIRRRLRRTQKAAGLRLLRFHDLRHSFGSLVVRELDTATLKSWMGHSKLATTERYLHAKPHSDVARLDRAFAGQAVDVDPLAATLEVPRRVPTR